MFAQKPKACKHCGKFTHVSMQCGLRQKPLKNYTSLSSKKPKVVWCTNCDKAGHTRMNCHQRIHKLAAHGKYFREWTKTRGYWFKLNRADHYNCHYCGKYLLAEDVTLDHLLARSTHPELRYHLSNLVPACWVCNSLKSSTPHDKYPHECKA